MKIGIVLPSRGLIFSRTAEEVVRESQDMYTRIFFSHKKPIPQCFEDPVTEALKDEAITHIWIVEDDMVLPKGILRKLADMNVAVATVDYPITKAGRGSVFRDADGKVLFSGTGCMLIKREVFEELRTPFFNSTTKWNVKNFGKYIKFTGANIKDKDAYGLHDINFCFELERLGIPIHVLKDTVLAQRKLVALGKSGTNDGAHNIEVWDKVIPNQRLKEIQSWPVEPTGNLVLIETDSGEMQCSKEHAKKLVKSGVAKYPPKRASVIMWGDQDASDSANNT